MQDFSKLIKGLYTKIRENGPLLISFYPRSHGWRYYSTVAKLANIIRFIILMRKPIEVGDDLFEGCYRHYFTQEELSLELHEAGFQIAHYCAKEYKNLHNDKTSVYGWAIGIKK